MARQTRPNPNLDPEFYSYASNKATSKRVFEERIKYDYEIFPPNLIPNSVKTWTTDRLYGTINHKGNAVVPNTSRLKSLRFPYDDRQTNFALDFVADAWYDLALRLKSLADNNEIYRNSPWAKPNVVKAWEPISSTYDDHMRTVVYPSFADNFMKAQGNDMEVGNIGTFINRLDAFIQDNLLVHGPITLSGFTEAKMTPIYASGLVIEIAPAPYDDDYEKGYKFLDANFPLVANIVAQYGFSIDANIPWRLVADLNNPAMIEYMLGVPLDEYNADADIEYECEPYVTGTPIPPRSGGFSQIPGLENVRRHVAFFRYTDADGNARVEPGYRRYKIEEGSAWAPTFNPSNPQQVFQSLFNQDYTETFYSDIDVFATYLLDFYNYYVYQHPYQPVVTLESAVSSCGPQVTRSFRQQMTREEFDSVYTDKWKLKTFFILRAAERGLVITQPSRRKTIQESMNLYNLLQAGNSATPYNTTLEKIQNEVIGRADLGVLTLQTVRDIMFSS